MEDKNVKVLLTLPESMRDALKKEADYKSLSLGTFIRMLLKERQENQKK